MKKTEFDTIITNPENAEKLRKEYNGYRKRARRGKWYLGSLIIMALVVVVLGILLSRSYNETAKYKAEAVEQQTAAGEGFRAKLADAEKAHVAEVQKLNAEIVAAKVEAESAAAALTAAETAKVKAESDVQLAKIASSTSNSAVKTAEAARAKVEAEMQSLKTQLAAAVAEAEKVKANAMQHAALAGTPASSAPSAGSVQRIELVSTQPVTEKGNWSMDKYLSDQVAKALADANNPSNAKYKDRIQKYADALAALRAGSLTFNQSSLVKDMIQGKRKLGTQQENKGADWLEQALAAAKVTGNISPN
jgi:hypothetical protein